MSEKSGAHRKVSLDVNTRDDPARIETKIRDARFESWQAVVDFVIGYGIYPDKVAGVLRSTDPAAGATAVSGFIWGMALALKSKDNDPCSAASWIARGMEDFTLPGSVACDARIATGLGKLATMLIRKFSNVMAIVGGWVPLETVEALLRLANHAGRLRGQTWHIIVLCREEESRKRLCGIDGYFHADAEFSREPGWLRVSRSTAFDRPDKSNSIVYVATTVEEGVAILDFEMANLCVALSEPEAAMFAHPVVGAYARNARRIDRIVKAVAIEILEVGTGRGDIEKGKVDFEVVKRNVRFDELCKKIAEEKDILIGFDNGVRGLKCSSIHDLRRRRYRYVVGRGKNAKEWINGRVFLEIANKISNKKP